MKVFVLLYFIRVFLTFIALFDMVVEQVDVKTTFLHGELKEESYMRQPKVVIPSKQHYACQFKKFLYKLKHVPRQ